MMRLPLPLCILGNCFIIQPLSSHYVYAPLLQSLLNHLHLTTPSLPSLSLTSMFWLSSGAFALRARATRREIS